MILNISSKLLILFVFIFISFNASGNPENGKFYGIMLNDSFQDNIEFDTYYEDLFDTKYIRYYRSIFGEAEDQITLSVTAITNTIYFIDIITFFESENEARSMLRNYMMYFDSLYERVKTESISYKWHVNENYKIYITFYEKYETPIPFLITNSSRDNDFKLKGSNGIIKFSFGYILDSPERERLNLPEKIASESNESKRQRALGSGVVKP